MFYLTDIFREWTTGRIEIHVFNIRRKNSIRQKSGFTCTSILGYLKFSIVTENENVSIFSSCVSCPVVSNSLQSHGLSMDFSRKVYGSGLPFLSPGNLLDPVIELRSPAFTFLQFSSVQSLSHVQLFYFSQEFKKSTEFHYGLKKNLVIIYTFK